MNGSTTVIKGTRRNGVYELNGEVKAGESGVSIDSNIDKTKLWHLRLGYMSESGLMLT